jgi:hypothetical protein
MNDTLLSPFIRQTSVAVCESLIPEGNELREYYGGCNGEYQGDAIIRAPMYERIFGYFTSANCTRCCSV